MDCMKRFSMLVITLQAIMFSCVYSTWQADLVPNSIVRLDDGLVPSRLLGEKKSSRKTLVQKFPGKKDEVDNFRLMLAEDDSVLVTAKNVIYNVSLISLMKNWEIVWKPEQQYVDKCRSFQKTIDECQNYIRVLLRKSRDQLYVCGTNAFKPLCRTYRQMKDGRYNKTHKLDVNGVGHCPLDPLQNNTAIYTDGKLYTATVVDFQARDPLILDTTNMIRTEQHNSKWLNDPNFVRSVEKDDKIYFFFREDAVENINCGKAVFSRVARICKNDSGGNRFLLPNTFTSFFKARLNCSVPGEYPFYFNEIKSATEMGQGNYRPTYDSGDRSDMIYGVFHTSQNSIHGSAVCAYRLSDIERTFEGKFKGQKSYWHNWVSIPWDETPKPHPVQCARHNETSQRSMTSLYFVKAHPLMDAAVPASGGTPLLLSVNPRVRLTTLAVDWQVHAADDRYYDVLFVGTDDGRIVKAINKGTTGEIETIVIEDIRVFPPSERVSDLLIFRNPHKGIEKLIVTSPNNIVSIPLHRCDKRKSCRTCVALQDPYCAWDGVTCSNTERGIQNVAEGWKAGVVDECGRNTMYDSGINSNPAVSTVDSDAGKCYCHLENGDIVEDMESVLISIAEGKIPVKTNGIETDHRIGVSREAEAIPGITTPVEALVVGVVISIVLSMLVGFYLGFKVSGCRHANDAAAEHPYLERTSSLPRRSRNRLSSGEHISYHQHSADGHTSMPKQINLSVSVKNNAGSVETKPITKSNNLYL